MPNQKSLLYILEVIRIKPINQYYNNPSGGSSETQKTWELIASKYYQLTFLSLIPREETSKTWEEEENLWCFLYVTAKIEHYKEGVSGQSNNQARIGKKWWRQY